MPQLNPNGSTFFTAERLTAHATQIYEEALRPLTANTLVAPTGGEKLGAINYTQETYEHSGRAAVIDSFGSDLPSSNVAVIEDTFNLAYIGTSYRITVADDRASAFAGRDVAAERGVSARRAIEELLNTFFFAGNAQKQVFGLAVYPYIARLAIGSADFAPGADPDDTLAALNEVCNAVPEATFEAEQADTLALDPITYRFCENTRASLDNSDSILTAFKKNRPEVTVIKVPEFARLSPTGGRIIMALSTQGRAGQVVHTVPDQLTIMTPEWRNLQYVINVIAQTGGFATAYPRAHAIGIIT